MRGGESVGDYLWVPIASSSSYSDVESAGVVFSTKNGVWYMKVAVLSGIVKVAPYYESRTGTNNFVFASNVVYSSPNVYNAYSYSSSAVYGHTITTPYNQMYYGLVNGYGDSIPVIERYDSLALALAAMDDDNWTGPAVSYPITYHYTNSTVSGPSEAVVGDTVIVSAVPDVGYGITDASTQIIVTNNDIAVPYTWDAVNQRITFTMPDPS